MNMMTKAILAGTALATLPTVAQAAVIVRDVSISVPNNLSGVYVNLVTGVTGTNGGTTAGWDINPYSNNGTLTFFTSSAGNSTVVTAAGGNEAADLAAGSVISAASFFKSSIVYATQFLQGGNHVLGFSFTNETTGMVDYGYARITTSIGTAGSLGFPATITQLVYENSGAALVVGGGSAVPEPASWAMMIGGFGAIGFAARRAKVSTKVSFA